MPENYLNILREKAAGRHLALLWQGNAHLAQFMFASNPMFDFVSSSRPKLPIHPGSIVVPESLVETTLVSSRSNLDYGIRTIGTTPASITVLATPPPKGDDDKMRQFIQNEPHFVAQASQMGADVASLQLTPRYIRLKLWLLLMKLYEEQAQELGVRFLKVPPECQDAEGFLKAEYWAQDVTHANSEYGSLLLDHILRSRDFADRESELSDEASL